jgi:very-short-patch-repair endonuclease
MVKGRIISESKHSHGADLNIKSKAKDLRKKMTVSEELLWNQLRGKKLKGMHFRRQHPYGIYILDFFCNKANLAIEIDGEIHKFREEYDYERTTYLEDTGLKIIRFTNSDIDKNIGEVLHRIKDYL